MELDTGTEDSAAAGDVDAGMDTSEGVSSRPKRTIKVNTRLSLVNNLNTRLSLVQGLWVSDKCPKMTGSESNKGDSK